MRSALTMLGVFIGVAALIVMVAVGQGANEAVHKQIESLGTNLVVSLPGRRHKRRHARRIWQRLDADRRRRQAIRHEAPAVGSVSYLIRQAGPGRIRAIRTGRPVSRASAPTIPRSPIGQSRAGLGISTDDESKAALVVVLGQTVFAQLFGSDENPLGAVIEVKDVPLRVIGVLAPKGNPLTEPIKTTLS